MKMRREAVRGLLNRYQMCVSLPCETNDTTDHREEEQQQRGIGSQTDRRECGRPLPPLQRLKGERGGGVSGMMERGCKRRGGLGVLGCQGDQRKRKCRFMRVVKGDGSSPETTRHVYQLILNPAICRGSNGATDRRPTCRLVYVGL